MVDLVWRCIAMNCLAKICYVCLEKDKLLSNINSSLSVYNDIVQIIDYLPFHLAWLKTLRSIFICEQCCLHLRETYQFLEKCRKNIALLQCVMNNLNDGTEPNSENLEEFLNITHKDMTGVECAVEDEDEKIQWRPNFAEMNTVCVNFEESQIKAGIICKQEVDDVLHNNSTETIEETEDVFVNEEDYFVKEENTWKWEEVDDTDVEDCQMDNNSTENIDNDPNSLISKNHDAHLTNADCVSSDNNFTTGTNNESDSEKSEIRNTHIADSDSECERGRIIEGSEDMFVNVDESFGKEKGTWKGDEVKDKEESPVDNNITEDSDKETDSKIAINSNTHDTECSGIIKLYLKKPTRVYTGDKSHRCSDCGKSFFLKTDLCRHKRVHTGEKPFKCSRCEKCFSVPSSLAYHVRIHTGEKPFKCSRCGKCFRGQTILVNHMRLHTDEKPFKCSRCDECFRQQSSLAVHMREHIGEEPFKCSQCKKSFSGQTGLAYHMRVHTGENPFKCSQCDKCFKQRSNLEAHMRVHTGERPFKCSRCDKCFTKRSNLDNHLRVHTGEKPFKCSTCEKCFSARSNLVCHLRLHTGEKPYECSICKKSFNQKSTLKRHMRIHTSENP